MEPHFRYKILQEFCEKNNIDLVEDYSGKVIGRYDRIKGYCKGEDCKNIFESSFRRLINHNAYNCKICVYEVRIEKTKKTNNEKYNVDNAFQSPVIKQKIKDKFMAEHKVEYTSQIPGVRAKARATMKKRFGYEYATQSPELLEKTKETNLAKYNTEWCITSKVVKDKVKATTKERYGHEHHNQNAEVAARASKTAYKAKDYTLPSGKVIRLQGYEPFCMDELLTVTTEDDIVTCRTEVPEIWYELNGKKHRYYVDIYVKSKDLCIEVKSTWTVKRDKEKIAAIREATKQMGIKYRVAVYGPKGERVQLIKK